MTNAHRWVFSSVVVSLFFSSSSLPFSGLSAEEAGPEEILVTARRRSEAVKDIPFAITALDSDTLDGIGAHALNDLTALAPNLTIVNGSAQSNAASIYIRGIGQRDSLQTFEQGVGLYVDGVYYSRMQASLARLFDVERVEVLRGPQGSLYGKNTVGGAVNILTRSPFAEDAGQLELTYGNYDQKMASGYLSTSLSDTAAVSVAAQYSKRDGFFSDPATGNEFNNDNVFVGRVKFGLKPSERLELLFAADVMEIDVAVAAGRSEDDVFLTDVVLGQQLAQAAPSGDFDGTLGVSIAPENGQTNTHYGFSLTADLAVDDGVALKSISAYRHMNPVNWLDADGTGLLLADVIATWVHQQFSQELQLAVTCENWDFVLGAFVMTEKSVAEQESFLDDFLVAGGVSLGFSRPGHDEQNVTTIAFFGHGNVAINDRLTASIGARWSRDDKSFFRVSETAFGGVVTESFTFDESEAWSAFTPSFALTYVLNENHNLFARIARGFRSGGFNGRLFSSADAQNFSPEFVWSYETGLKGTSADKNIRYGLNAFYNNYTDYQARIAVAVDSADPAAGFNFPTVNAAKLEIYGAEFEVAADFDALSLWANVGLLNASYKEFIDARGDKTGEQPIRSPDATLNAGFSYDWTIGSGGSVQLAADARYISSYYTSVDNSEKLFEDGYMLVNATLKWAAADNIWYAKAGGRNLFDAVYQTDAFEFRTLGNVQTAFYGDPRTWYLSIGRSF